MKQAKIVYLTGSEKQWRCSDWADAQAGLRLCFLHVTKSGFLASRPIYTRTKMISQLFSSIAGAVCSHQPEGI